MKREKETEFKLRALDPDWWEKITVEPNLLALVVPGSRRAESFEASYYDTPQGHLRRAGFVYRVRREGDRWMATVKADAGSVGGMSQRWEWNVPVEDHQPDFSVFMATAAGKGLKKALVREKPVELFVTRFERQSYLLSLPDGSRIECAADWGEIIAGNRREPIAELELELKGGELSALLKLGAVLATEHALLPESSSKFERGLRLAGISSDVEQAFDQGKSKAKTKSKQGKPAKLREGPAKSDKAALALPNILLDAVYNVLAVQTAFIANPEEAENWRRLENKLSRLSSLLAFAAPYSGMPELLGVQEDLEAICREFTAWRRCARLCNTWEDLLKAQDVSLVHGPLFRDVLESESQEQKRRLLATVRQGKTTPVLLRLWGLLLDWIAGQSSGLRSSTDLTGQALRREAVHSGAIGAESAEGLPEDGVEKPVAAANYSGNGVDSSVAAVTDADDDHAEEADREEEGPDHEAVVLDKGAGSKVMKLSLGRYAGQAVRSRLQEFFVTGPEPDFGDAAIVQDLLSKAVVLRGVLKQLGPILERYNPLERAIKEIRDKLQVLADTQDSIRYVDELAAGSSQRLLRHETGVLSGWEAYHAANVRQGLSKEWRHFYQLVEKFSNQ